MRNTFRFIVAFCLFPTSLFAGVRELCRAELSGLMITASSDLKMYEDLTVSLKESLDSFTGEKKRLDQEYAKKSQKSEKGNIYSEQELNELQTRQNTINQQISELNAERQNAKVHSEKSRQRVKDLESRLRKIFEFTRVQEPEAGLMTWRLDYKSPCPKFRQNCPLPEPMRVVLKTILGAETPENCSHYANIK